VPATALVMVKGGSAANNLLAFTLLLVPFVVQSVDALLPRLARRPALAKAAAALGLAWALGRAALDVPPMWTHIAAHDRALAAARRLDEVVRSAEGPVWVPLDISLAYRNGVAVVSPAAILAEYNFDPAIWAPLLSALEAGAFQTILLHDTLFTLLPEPVFGPPIRASYRPVELVVSTPSVGLYGSVIVLERKE